MFLCSIHTHSVHFQLCANNIAQQLRVVFRKWGTSVIKIWQSSWVCGLGILYAMVLGDWVILGDLRVVLHVALRVVLSCLSCFGSGVFGFFNVVLEASYNRACDLRMLHCLWEIWPWIHGSLDAWLPQLSRLGIVDKKWLLVIEIGREGNWGWERHLEQKARAYDWWVQGLVYMWLIGIAAQTAKDGW